MERVWEFVQVLLPVLKEHSLQLLHTPTKQSTLLLVDSVGFVSPVTSVTDGSAHSVAHPVAMYCVGPSQPCVQKLSQLLDAHQVSWLLSS